VLAGLDLEAQGTWLGITRAGRIAAVTNVRHPDYFSKFARSRGQLTREFLTGEESAQEYLAQIEPNKEHYAGFNLFLVENGHLYYSTNQQKGRSKLNPGIYGLSNASLDTGWPKLTAGKQEFTQILRQSCSVSALLNLLSDTHTAPDELLPDTGIGLERERTLSSRFIVTPDYGTRCSTIIRVNLEGEVDFTERSFLANGDTGEERKFTFELNED